MIDWKEIFAAHIIGTGLIFCIYYICRLYICRRYIYIAVLEADLTR